MPIEKNIYTSLEFPCGRCAGTGEQRGSVCAYCAGVGKVTKVVFAAHSKCSNVEGAK